MSNVKYTFSKDGQTAYGEMPDGSVFMIDSDRLPEVSDINFYFSGFVFQKMVCQRQKWPYLLISAAFPMYMRVRDKKFFRIAPAVPFFQYALVMLPACCRRSNKP